MVAGDSTAEAGDTVVADTVVAQAGADIGKAHPTSGPKLAKWTARRAVPTFRIQGLPSL
jgi:hypothetical protein